MIKKAATIFIGFIHDFAAGCWAASVLAVYWLHRIDDAGLKAAAVKLMKEFFYLGLICVAIVFVAGMGRTFTYAHIGHVYGEDAEKLRKKMLIVKHVVLILVFGSGLYWQYSMVFDR